MNKSTLLTAALAVVAMTANAQTPAQAQKAQQVVKAFFSPKKTIKKASQQVNTPSLATNYSYNNGEWEYDNEVEYTYNVNQNITQTITKNGDNYLNKTTYTYDSTMPSFMTKVDYQEWSTSLNDWGEAENLLTNTLTRNDDGTLASVHTVSNGYNEEEGETTVTISYDDNKIAKEVDYTYTDDGTPITFKFKNLVWKKVDGDFFFDAALADDFSEFMEGNNLLESADVTMSGNGITYSGPLTTTYTDQGWGVNVNMSCTFMGYTFNVEMTFSKEYTDDNGSYIMVQAADYGTQAEYIKEVVTKDAHNSIIQDDIYYGESADDATFYSSAKADMTYDESGRPVEQIVSNYNTNTETYDPYSKTELEYTTNGITNATIITPTFEKGIYNVNGILMGQSLETLPAGLYIVYDGSKTEKIVKR